MKVMVVSNSSALRGSIAKVLDILMGVEIIKTDHEEALEEFLVKEPDRVIVCEYDETGTGQDEYNRGRSTYKDIRNSASEDVVVVRMGFPRYDYEDYIAAPFQLEELIKKLQL